MSYINGSLPEQFEAQAYQSGKFITVNQDNFIGNWSVLFFYPADFTFVCPTELGDLQDLYADFKSAGVEVYGISTDTHFVHKAWADASDTIGKITYPLIGDPSHFLSNWLAVLGADGLADRATFVFDPDGKIQIVELNCGGVGRDAKELLRKIKAAIHVRNNPGEVCPAKWTEGAATLAPSLDLVGKI